MRRALTAAQPRRISIVMSHVVFDRALIRRRRYAARRREKRPEFLETAIAAELNARLLAVSRNLDVIVLQGDTDGLPALAASGRPSSRMFLSDMVERRGCHLVLDDEALPLADASLDAFVHAGGLESVNDLPGTLVQIRRALRPDGLFLGAALGGDTLVELREAALAAELLISGGATPRVAPFVPVQEWGLLLQRAGFALPVADRDRLTVRYDSALDLIVDLKALGFSNPLVERSRAPVSRRFLSAIAESYARSHADSDGRVRASFEIVYLIGWCPHEDQPKPLRPGTAVARLADALGTSEQILKRR
jgi:SAM-dependent methyltransferase